MITNLNTKNFRAFEELDLNFSKINLFLGPNNSGKSSILSTLILLSQTLKSLDKETPLLLSGQGVMKDFGTYGDIVFNNNTKKEVSINLGIHPQIPSGRYPPLLRGNIPKEGIKGKIELKYKYRPRKHKIILNSCEVEMPPEERAIKTKYVEYSEKIIIGEFFKQKKGLPNLRMYNFIPQVFRYNFSENTFILNLFLESLIKEVQKIEYLGPFRAHPERTYLFSGESPSSIGKHGESAVYILVEDYYYRGKKKINIVNKVSNWFRKSEIADKIYIKRLTEKHFEMIISHLHSKEKENLADVGFGCSQVLPILVAGYNLKPNNIMLVEQPEIHLHPKAQAELGTFFKDVALNNIQLFIETHSEHLLLRVQAHVASGDLKPEDVKVYYVYSNKDKGGKKDVVELPLTDEGYFSKEWPEGFFPERLEEAKKIAKAALKKPKKNE